MVNNVRLVEVLVASGFGGGGDVQCPQRAVREREPGGVPSLAQPVAARGHRRVHGGQHATSLSLRKRNNNIAT